jgi:hypothetical protein
MKTVATIFISLMLSGVAISQSGFYVGYENGGKLDKFFYVNSKGNSLSQWSIDGVWGAYAGYKIKRYTFETGLYGYYTSHPFIDYDYDTGIPTKSNSSGGSSGMNNWMIPLRFGMEFLFANNAIFIKPELSFTILVARDYSDEQPNGGWGENVSPFPGDTNYVGTTSDSTRAFSYRTEKVNFGMESGISLGYRFKERADIYFKGTYFSSFNPVYYESITHYSDTEIVTATNTYVGNSFLLQIGLRFYFKKTDD